MIPGQRITIGAQFAVKYHYTSKVGQTGVIVPWVKAPWDIDDYYPESTCVLVSLRADGRDTWYIRKEDVILLAEENASYVSSLKKEL